MLFPSGLWLRLMWYPATTFSKETWCLQLQEELPNSEAAVSSGQSITSYHIASGHVLDGDKSSFWQTSHCDLIYDKVFCGSRVPAVTQDAGSMSHKNFVPTTLHKTHKATLWIAIAEKTANVITSTGSPVCTVRCGFMVCVISQPTERHSFTGRRTADLLTKRELTTPTFI